MGNKKTTKNRRKLGTHNSKRSKVKGSTDGSMLRNDLDKYEISSLCSWILSIAARNRKAQDKLENIQHVPDESPFSLQDPQTEEQRLVR